MKIRLLLFFCSFSIRTRHRVHACLNAATLSLRISMCVCETRAAKLNFLFYTDSRFTEHVPQKWPVETCLRECLSSGLIQQEGYISFF